MKLWGTRRLRCWRQLGRWLALALLMGLTSCTTASPATTNEVVLAGDPAAGRVALQAYGCHACHVIPGVTGANSLVGPPLIGWAERAYIAGRLPNEPAHLVAWIQYPQAIEPGTAMPNLGVTEEDAVNMSAYLYTLERDQSWYSRLAHFFTAF